MGNLNFPALFLDFVYLSKSAGNHKLTDKQKTENAREIQILGWIPGGNFFLIKKKPEEPEDTHF